MPFPETAAAPDPSALLQPLDGMHSAGLTFPADSHAALLGPPPVMGAQPPLALGDDMMQQQQHHRPSHQASPQHHPHANQPHPVQQQQQHQQHSQALPGQGPSLPTQHQQGNPHDSLSHVHQHPHQQPPQHPSQQAQHHPHYPQHPQAHHQQPPQHPQHPQPPQQTDGAAGSYTYANLTDGIISHIFFPLVVKRIFEIFSDRPLPADLLAPHFDNLEQRALDLKSYGEVYGLEGACEKYASVDLFMSAMVSSLASLKPRIAGGAIDALLADTLAVASAAVRGQALAPTATGAHSLLGGIGASTAVGDGDRLLDRLGIQSPGVGKGGESLSVSRRRKLKPAARRCLEDWFQNHLESPYPNDADKHALAAQCGLDVQQVNNFFGNKRMRMKRKMMALHPGEVPVSVPSPKGPPKDGAPSVLAPQSKWENVVLSKLESPVARQALGVDDRGNAEGAAVNGSEGVVRASTRSSVTQPRPQQQQKRGPGKDIDPRKQHMPLQQPADLLSIRPLSMSPTTLSQPPGPSAHQPGALSLSGGQSLDQAAQRSHQTQGVRHGGQGAMQQLQQHPSKQHSLRSNRFQVDGTSRDSTAPEPFYCEE